MENQTISQEEMWRKIEKSQRRGKIMGGLLIIAAGILFLAKELGAEIPFWVFSWKILLMSIGVILAVKHKFMHPGWIVLVGIGGVFLLNDLYPDMHIKPFLWPVLLILLGLLILFKPKRRDNYRAHYWKKWHQHHHGHHPRGFDQFNPRQRCDFSNEAVSSDEDFIDSTNVMGGVKKNILSKKFKGGDVVNVLGGAHLDLTQADFEGTATLDITQIFGGTKLIVPANWEIKSETVTVCGGIEDKRPVKPLAIGEPVKVLLLIGTTVFGGIEIKNHE